MWFDHEISWVENSARWSSRLGWLSEPLADQLPARRTKLVPASLSTTRDPVSTLELPTCPG